MAIDEGKLHELVFKMVGDMGAAAVAPLVVLGDRLGLYRALAAGGPLSSAELADRTNTTERYVRESVRRAGGLGIHQLRRRQRHLQHESRANRGVCRPR